MSFPQIDPWGESSRRIEARKMHLPKQVHNRIYITGLSFFDIATKSMGVTCRVSVTVLCRFYIIYRSQLQRNHADSASRRAPPDRCRSAQAPRSIRRGCAPEASRKAN